LTLLAPLTLLCACAGGTPELSIESNWYNQTGERHVISPTNETLVYDISFVPSEDAEGAQYTMSYENGTFTTTLKNENITLGDGTVAMGYHFTTNTEIDVKFTLNSVTSDALHDTMETHALFLDTDKGLKPVKSWQTVHSHTPNGMPSASFASLRDSYKQYDYTLTTEYNTELTEAKMKLDYLDTEEDNNNEPTSVSIKGSGSYFDNEQILFALRGLDITSALTFRTVNPNSRQKVSVSLYDAPEPVRETCTFTMNGEEKKEVTIEAYEFSLMYSQKYSGQSKKFVYAKKTSPTNNVYRNLPLRMESPVLHSHGTLIYKLKSADLA
ncbi:MAG: hypothetical protein K2N74_06485, partial [Clostridiales bacterium]|nr:hypothetical protein [Clostridiales bacterium]